VAQTTRVISNLNDTLPEAPAGCDNVKWQINRGVTPPNISANVPRADVAGDNYGTIIYDGSEEPLRYLGADGYWHDIPEGSLPNGGTPGQVLTMSNDSPPAPEWADQTGGSGGGNGVFTYTPPVLSNFTWVNQVDAVATQVGNVVTLTNNVNIDTNWNLLVRALPSRPCTITAWLIPHLTNNNYVTMGIVLRENSSGKLIANSLTYSGGCQVIVSLMNNTGSWNSNKNYKNISYPYSFGLRFVISDASPNVISFQCSWDGSVWYELDTESFGSFCTPDQIGFFINRYHYQAWCGMTLLSWEES
jgi:hypothetical protein